MKTLNQIIYAIKERLNDYSDDVEYPTKYLAFLVNSKRASFVKRDFDNLRHSLDSSLLQSVCEKLEFTDEMDCCSDVKGCKILRTVRPLPSIFSSKYRDGIQSVGPSSMASKKFDRVSESRLSFIQYSPFSKSIFWFLNSDNRIYIVSKSKSVNLLESVRIVAAFDDVEELSEFKDCSGKICYDYDSDYPIPSHMIDSIINEIVNELTRSDKSNLEDRYNDGETQS